VWGAEGVPESLHVQRVRRMTPHRGTDKSLKLNSDWVSPSRCSHSGGGSGPRGSRPQTATPAQLAPLRVRAGWSRFLRVGDATLRESLHYSRPIW
jgi:hypothetical protein